MLYLDEEARRRLRGYQDAWLTKRAADKPEPKRKPRNINKDRRRHLVDSAAHILRQGQPTFFAYEGACRHGIRSALCLDGWNWQDADAVAAEIVKTALNRIGAKRPSWAQGQPEHTQEGFAPIERTRCRRCGAKIPEEEHRYGYRREFCSTECGNYHRAAIERISGEKRGYAQYWASLAAAGQDAREKRERPCEWCGSRFIPRSNVEDIRHCSKSCAAKSRGHARKRMKPCEACGRFYHVSGPGAGKRFCSKACWNSAHEIKPKKCEWCDALFKPPRPERRFCSPRCSARWRVSGFTCETAE